MGRRKKWREIKIASGGPKIVLKECVCILAAILQQRHSSDGLWLQDPRLDVVDLQATAMTEQCMIGLCWIRGDMHAKQKPSNVADARAH